jgi:hypothetical protein
MASDFECSIMVVDELLAQNTNNGTKHPQWRKTPTMA